MILPIKNAIAIFFILSLFLLTGCQKADTIETSVYKTKGPFSIEMETFTDQKYGYTLDLPKSWGAIQPYGSAFTDDPYDEMETIGPFLPHSMNINFNEHYLDIEVFTDEATLREPNESWIDFYKKLRLEDAKYEERRMDNNKFTEIIGLNDAGEYKSTCRLMEGNDSLYSFCYHRENNIHQDIINSIRLR